MEKTKGIKSLRVIKEEDYEKYFFYWNEMKPGIFVPDE